MQIGSQVELLSKTVLQHSPKQLKQMGTVGYVGWVGMLKKFPPKIIKWLQTA